MRIAILGTGVVGAEIGRKLIAQGHQVMLGSRTRDNARAAEWTAAHQPNGSHGTFAEAAAFGHVVFNCTNGAASLDAMNAAGADNLADKILIDVANPLDFSKGMPPTLTVCNTDSLGEQIQRAFPATHVVKTLNTVNCYVMTSPASIPGDHGLYVCGNNGVAKEQVSGWLGEWFGWKQESIFDLGDITAARGTEMILPLWIRVMVKLGSPMFNFQIQRAPQQTVMAEAAPVAH